MIDPKKCLIDLINVTRKRLISVLPLKEYKLDYLESEGDERGIKHKIALEKTFGDDYKDYKRIRNYRRI